MILRVFNCESDTNKFFEFSDTQHPNIKFKFKKQVKQQN